MSLSVHPFVQNSDDFDAMYVGSSEEDYMTPLWELSVPLSNRVSARCNLGRLREAFEGIKQLSNISISLSLTPLFQRMLRDLSQICIRCPRNPECSHSY